MQIEPWLRDFITESNRIEGISGVSEAAEIAHADFLAKESITVEDLEVFVQWIAPGHRLRDKHGLDVRVGRYIPPEGGPLIEEKLNGILVNLNLMSPFKAHIAYESLHPFTDGNGRSGRALWLWHVLQAPAANRVKSLGFLHTFYYQTLEASDRSSDDD